MKKFLPLMLIAVLMPLLFTACDDDDYYYYTYDSNLPGTWELISADGRPVTGYQVNYLEFYKNGTGTYYYYNNMRPYEMALSWVVDYYYDANVLRISYADGTYAEMDYWYNSNYTRLYTTWYSGGYQHTYVYQYVSGPAWNSAKKQLQAAPAPEALSEGTSISEESSMPKPGE